MGVSKNRSNSSRNMYDATKFKGQCQIEVSGLPAFPTYHGGASFGSKSRTAIFYVRIFHRDRRTP